MGRETLQERYAEVLLGLLPPGKIFGRVPGDVTSRFARGLAGAFADVRLALDAFVERKLPHQALDPELAAWEHDLGLPSTGTIEERQERVAAKLLERLGHSLPDLLAVAASLGVDQSKISVIRFWPFRSGVSRAGERLTNRYWSHTVVFVIDAPPSRALEVAFETRRRSHATFIFLYPGHLELEQGGYLELEQGGYLELEQA